VTNQKELEVGLNANADPRQRGTTKTMIFDCATLVSYVSQFMTLMPGDIITTGTPPGVGAGMKPPQFLKAGDTIALGIQGLGEQRQKVVRYKA
jgi:2,4-didehydro-3-deoxy-L-rhamnonate hydrolase